MKKKYQLKTKEEKIYERWKNKGRKIGKQLRVYATHYLILFFLNTIIIVMNEARKMKWSIF